MTSQEWAAWVGSIGQLISAGSLIFLLYQVKYAKEQILSTKNINESEQLYMTFRFLSEVRHEMEHVIGLEHKDFRHWNDEDKRAAIVVASRFNLVGALIFEKSFPQKLSQNSGGMPFRNATKSLRRSSRRYAVIGIGNIGNHLKS